MLKYYKRDNDDIEKKANNLLSDLLNDLFVENDLKLIEHESGRREIGIDFFYQIFNRSSNKQILFFEVQNKGTDKGLKVIKTKMHPEFGKISFQLELRHIKQYYFEMTEPLLFILCDINSKKAYWYPIQIDSTIPNRIKEKEESLKKKKSKNTTPTLQIYISKENEICSKNFKAFFDDIELSREEQIRKHNFNISSEADYSFLEDKIKDKHIIDQLYITIEEFEGIHILPPNVITSLPIIREVSDRYRVWIHNFSIKIDNEVLYNLISNIELVDGELKLKGGNIVVDNQEYKLLSIIKFFQANYIKHINWGGKDFKERICVHDLFIYSNCDCARCNFDELKLERTKLLIKEKEKKETLFEQLRKGYAAYLVGDLSKSVSIFNEINSEASKLDSPILYVISKYNLIQLRKIIKWNYFKSGKEDLLEKTKVGSLNGDEGYIKKKAPHFVDVFNFIKDDTFYKNASGSIDDILDEAREMSFYDKHGSVYSHNKVDKLTSSLLRFYSFSEYNYLIFDYFYEYKSLMTKVLEASFALHNISNPKSSKYKEIDFLIIKMWLFHVPFKKAKTLLHKYDFKRINTVLITEQLISYIDNLYNSISVLSIDNTPYYFGDKIERIIKNLTLLLSRINISDSELNLILAKILKFVNEFGQRKLIPFESFQQLFEYKEISKENAHSILKIYIEDDSLNSYAIKVYVEKASKEEIKQLILESLKVKRFSSKLVDNKKFTKIPYAISLLDEKLKSKVQKLIEKSLKKEFNDELFHISVLYDLIKFDEGMFNKFLLTIPDKSKLKESEIFYDNGKNYKLSSVVNIMYKFNLLFTNDVKKYVDYCIDEEKEYYKWLMDLDGFDYSKFNLHWVLEYRTKFFIKAFRKSKKLRKEIKRELRRKYVDGVAKYCLHNKII